MLWNSSPSNSISGSVRTNNNNVSGRVVAILLLGILLLVIAVFTVIVNRPDKFTRSALEAARKETPDAKVRDVRVSGGFARAVVSDPKAKSQIRSGNVTFFRVNEDGSMTQIASGSSFSPIELINMGISLPVQADITGISLEKVMKNLYDVCGYPGDGIPGYADFGGSFHPDGWQIDSSTLGGIKRVLNTINTNHGQSATSDNTIVCIIATDENNNAVTDTKTYVTVFSLGLIFVTKNGDISNHEFTFSVGPKQHKVFTLDGQQITDTSN